MKRKLLLILSLCLILACSVFFAACNGGGDNNDGNGGGDTNPHTHTYETAWTYDNDYHWHKANCEHKDEISGKAKHTVSNGKCSECDYEEEEPSDEEKQGVPVYTGMTVSNAVAAQAKYVVAPLAEEEYRAGKNEDVFITIHFDNPKNFEILSFTLNNKKYASYMFEYGSSMENVIIKENMGNADLNVEFTIDAIKYVDGEAIKDVKIGGNKTIKVMVEYNITYHLDGGDKGDNPSKYIMNDEIEFEDATKRGYTFKGWYEDKACTKAYNKIERYSSGDKEVYAKWEIITYTITYHLNGGAEVENETTYTVESDTITLNKTTKKYYTFKGWYTDELFTERIDAIEHGSVGNLDLYAKWFYGTEGLEYKLNDDDTYTIIGYTGTSTEVIIPDEWMGLPITEIDSAFNGCTELTSVIFVKESRITTIRGAAFADCINLTSIEIPSSVTAFYAGDEIKLIKIAVTIEDDPNMAFSALYPALDAAFMGCSNLTSVTFEENSRLMSIGADTFIGCNNLKNIEIPSGVTEIGYAAFLGCLRLESVIIGNDSQLTSIEESVFENCLSLSEITIPSSVTSIGERAFYECGSLVEIVIPDGVASIGSDAFAYCSRLNGVYISDIAAWCKISFGNYSANPLYYGANLYLDGVLVTKLTIPNEITKINDYAFSGCSSLSEITIPSGVTSIGDYAFSGCSKLTSVTFGEDSQLTSIGDRAFYYCDSLSEITIPSGVTSIGGWAFYNCTSLSTVYWNATNCTSAGSFIYYSDYTIFKGCTELTTVVIGENVENIPSYAFYGCSKLNEITIPDSVTSIGEYAFDFCSSLKTVYYGGTSSSQWNQISIGSSNYKLTGATRYYYSDTRASGYWHYNSEGKPELWDDTATASPSAILENCYHISNGTQGNKMNSVEKIVTILKSMWDNNILDFDTTIDETSPTLRTIND